MKFTEEKREGVIDRVRIGVSQADAARAVGVSEKTVKHWLTRGRKEDAGQYAEFADAVAEARAEAAERVEPMDRDELARVVAQAARGGSVQAMKLQWEMLRAKPPDEESEPADGFEALDELEERRQRQAS